MNLSINTEVKKKNPKTIKWYIFTARKWSRRRKSLSRHVCIALCFCIKKKRGAAILILMKCQTLLPLFSGSTHSSLAPLVCELVVHPKGVTQERNDRSPFLSGFRLACWRNVLVEGLGGKGRKERENHYPGKPPDEAASETFPPAPALQARWPDTTYSWTDHKPNFPSHSRALKSLVIVSLFQCLQLSSSCHICINLNFYIESFIPRIIAGALFFWLNSDQTQREPYYRYNLVSPLI